MLAAPNAPAAPEDPEVAESQPWYLQCAVPMPVRGDTTATTVVVTREQLEHCKGWHLMRWSS